MLDINILTNPFLPGHKDIIKDVKANLPIVFNKVAIYEELYDDMIYYYTITIFSDIITNEQIAYLNYLYQVAEKLNYVQLTLSAVLPAYDGSYTLPEIIKEYLKSEYAYNVILVDIIKYDFSLSSPSSSSSSLSSGIDYITTFIPK